MQLVYKTEELIEQGFKQMENPKFLKKECDKIVLRAEDIGRGYSNVFLGETQFMNNVVPEDHFYIGKLEDLTRFLLNDNHFPATYSPLFI